MKKPRTHDPWMPAPYEDADIYAVRALFAGKASEDQQKRFVAWLINHAAGTYDLPFHPGGHEGDRATSFACGRMFVGQQTIKLSKITTKT